MTPEGDKSSEKDKIKAISFLKKQNCFIQKAKIRSGAQNTCKFAMFSNFKFKDNETQIYATYVG